MFDRKRRSGTGQVPCNSSLLLGAQMVVTDTEWSKTDERPIAACAAPLCGTYPKVVD